MPIPIDLTGKPICITGASAGIGRATAILCARAGMPVLAAVRREDRLRSLVEEIRAFGGRAEWQTVDVADPASNEAMIARAIDAFGSLYAVFANAGYGVECAMHEMSDEDLRRIFEVNFFGSMHTIRPALPHLLERGEGHVLFCSSCVAKFALPYYGAYSATKAAQNHVSRAMRLELEPYGVHVSSVHPIGTKTEFFETAKAHSKTSRLVEHSSERFMQTPERVARAVVKCLRKPRPEVWTSIPVHWGMSLSTAIPRVADASVRWMVKRRFENGAAEACRAEPAEEAR